MLLLLLVLAATMLSSINKLDIMYDIDCTTISTICLHVSRRVLPKMINTKDLRGFRGAILTEMWN